MILRCLLFFALITISVQTCSNSTSKADNAWSVELLNASVPINNTFTTNIKGSSTDGKFAIQISNDQGQVTQNSKKTAVVVNAQIPWTSNLTLYGFIGADSSGILMGWAYCSPNNKLTALWLEDTSGQAGFTKSTVTGSCNATNSSQATNYQIPGECVAVDQPSSHPTIQGSDISLQPHGVGSVSLKEDYNLLPFEIVNCLKCGNSSSDGWVEVHSVLSSKTSSNVCIGIFYLYAQQKPSPSVLLAYLNCFQEQETDFQWLSANYDISGHTLQASTSDSNTTMPDPTTQMPTPNTPPNAASSSSTTSATSLSTPSSSSTSDAITLQRTTAMNLAFFLIFCLSWTMPFS